MESSPFDAQIDVEDHQTSRWWISSNKDLTGVFSVKEQKRFVDSSTLQREAKKVRKAGNRRQEWNMMAFDKELRPDPRRAQSLRRGGSLERCLSPDGRHVFCIL